MASKKSDGGAPAEASAPIVEEAGTGEAAVRVEGLSQAAVALGEAVAVGGPPAAGEGQVAEAIDGPAIGTTKVADDAARDDLGWGVTQRSVEVAARPVTGAEIRRSGRNEVLPLAAPTVDPDMVSGLKVATAAAQVRRDGRSYRPGETFEIDFRAHSELVPIGAIVAVPWHELPDADEA